MSENREWLAHKGLPTAGKSAELKARVKEWLDNAVIQTVMNEKVVEESIV